MMKRDLGDEFEINVLQYNVTAIHTINIEYL